MKPQALRAEKKIQLLRGSLIRPLIIGKPAVFTSGGKVYRTSRVIRLHERTQEEIHFETATAHYHLIAGPFPIASAKLPPARLMACA